MRRRAYLEEMDRCSIPSIPDTPRRRSSEVKV